MAKPLELSWNPISKQSLYPQQPAHIKLLID